MRTTPAAPSAGWGDRRGLSAHLLGIFCLSLFFAGSAGCKRTADAPLPRQALFPDVVEHQAPPAESEMARAELMQAAEPDNSRSEARKIPRNVVISGSLDAPADKSDGASPTAKRRWLLLDDDWFRLEADPEQQLVTRVELRDAPRCARLDVFGAGSKPVRQAPWHRGVRPVIPGLRLDGGALWLRVRCLVRRKPRKGAEPRRGGPYRLAVSTRPRRADEEQEPNDKLGAETQVLLHGQTVQATLAPRNDTDLFRLDLSAAEPGAAQMLSVNGSPGVDLEVALLTAKNPEPVLIRSPARGQGVLVPNLDVRRTGTQVVLRIRSRRGQAPDAPYAATVRALMPSGCTDKEVCPAKVPVEREPNDTRVAAMGVKAGSLISGVLDGKGDEDWYAIDGKPGDVVQIRLRAPEGLAVELSAGDVGRPWVTLKGKPDGERVTLAGWRTGKRRVYVRVAGVDGSADATALYFLRVQFLELPHFETEGTLQALSDAGEQRLQRQGVLLPAGDTDSFWLDWTARAGASNVDFSCRGDGLPGLTCTLTDAAGVELAKLAAPAEQGETRVALELPAGKFTVSVKADTPRASRSPYTATIEDKGLIATALPGAVTASLRALLGDPESVAPAPSGIAPSGSTAPRPAKPGSQPRAPSTIPTP